MGVAAESTSVAAAEESTLHMRAQGKVSKGQLMALAMVAASSRPHSYDYRRQARGGLDSPRRAWKGSS